MAVSEDSVLVMCWCEVIILTIIYVTVLQFCGEVVVRRELDIRPDEGVFA